MKHMYSFFDFRILNDFILNPSFHAGSMKIDLVKQFFFIMYICLKKNQKKIVFAFRITIYYSLMNDKKERSKYLFQRLGAKKNLLVIESQKTDTFQPLASEMLCKRSLTGEFIECYVSYTKLSSESICSLFNLININMYISVQECIYKYSRLLLKYALFWYASRLKYALSKKKNFF